MMLSSSKIETFFLEILLLLVCLLAGLGSDSFDTSTLAGFIVTSDFLHCDLFPMFFFRGQGLQLLTHGTLSLVLMPNPPSLTPYVPPTKKDWDTLFQPMFDEYFSHPPSVASLVPTVIAPEPADSTIPEPNSEESSLRDVIPNNVDSVNQPLEHPSKWTKDHPLDNVIGNPSRLVSTRHQLKNEAMFCYFNAFHTSVELKNYKEAL
nr:hypothetical protein [Tanacetum cinerariifolium]